MRTHLSTYTLCPFLSAQYRAAAASDGDTEAGFFGSRDAQRDAFTTRALAAPGLGAEGAGTQTYADTRACSHIHSLWWETCCSYQALASEQLFGITALYEHAIPL